MENQTERTRNVQWKLELGNAVPLSCIHLEGQGDTVTRLVMGIFRVTISVVGIYSLTYHVPLTLRVELRGSRKKIVTSKPSPFFSSIAVGSFWMFLFGGVF